MLLIGVVALLYGIIRTWLKADYARGIWPAGIGTVLVVLVLFLIAGWNATAYYPSNADLQSSLTIANSCSSLFTLKTMFYVSLLRRGERGVLSSGLTPLPLSKGRGE